MGKVAIYTVITGNYDELRTPSSKEEGFDYYLFTDNREIQSDFWNVVHVEDSEGLGVKKLSRKVKLLPHIYLSSYEYTIYIDGNIDIVGSLKEFFFVNKSDFSIAKHPARNCYTKEASVIIRLRKDLRDVVVKQKRRYMKLVPKGQWLTANSIILRKNCDLTNKICDDWWREVKQFSYRDQMSVNYAFWLNNSKPQFLMDTRTFKVSRVHGLKPKVDKENIGSIFEKLDKKKLVFPRETQIVNVDTDIRIHFISPFPQDKMYGKALNHEISLIPGDDTWICVRDYDTMPLTKTFRHIIDKAIQNNTDTVLFSCYTNRLGLRYQLHGGTFSNETDIMYHMNIAEERADMFNNGECHELSRREPPAGLFMLFQKKYWKQNKFIDGIIGKGGNYFDALFTKEMFKFGKVKLIKGLYIFHQYRMGKQFDLNKRYTEHLY